MSSGTGMVAAADDDVRLNAHAAQLAHAVLRRLRLQFARGADVGQEGTWIESVSSRPSSLRIWRIASRNGWLSISPTVPPTSMITTSASAQPRHAADPALDLVREVRDRLDRAAEIVAPPLAPDHLLVDLAGGHGAGPGEVLVDEALVVAKVEVCLGAVDGDEDLAVLIGRHGAGIDVEVGIELLDGDGEAAALEDSPEGGGGDALADGTDHATGYENVFCHTASTNRNRPCCPQGGQHQF